MCTAQPVNVDYSPFDPVKSMCDQYVFNTIITRPKLHLVAVGNPFRLRKIEENSKPPACWTEYLFQCWEWGSLTLSAKLQEGLESKQEACTEQVAALESLMFQSVANKMRRTHPKEKKVDTILLGYSGLSQETAVQGGGWKLGEEKQIVVVKGKQYSSLTRCKLDGDKAIPVKPGLKPFSILSVDERRCALDGAIVMVEEAGNTLSGRHGKVVSVEQQGSADPIICTVDSLSPLILLPVSGKNPKLFNLPVRNEAVKKSQSTKETPIEAVVESYSPQYLKHSTDAIPFKLAHSMFFIVQPQEWSVQERFPVGAVIGILPKYPPLQLAELVLAIQHKASTKHPTTTATKSKTCPPPLPSVKSDVITAIGIQHPTMECSFTFSVVAKENHFILAVHVSNVVSRMEGFEKSFSVCSASQPVLPTNVIEACDFSKNPIQTAITVEFKVEGKNSISVAASRRDMMVTELTVTPIAVRESVVHCNNILTASDAEDIILVLQRGPVANRRLVLGPTLGVHDVITILYSAAESQHKARHGHNGYSLLEMASLDYPETGKMVNELLTMANSEVAQKIIEAFPDGSLLKTQVLPDHMKEEITELYSEDLCLLPEPAIYPWLVPQHGSEATPRPSQPCIIMLADVLKELITALTRVDFLEARQLLYFLHYHPQFAALQEAVRTSLTPEQFSVSSSKDVNNIPTHFVRPVPYTSFTDPFRCTGDIYVQEQILAAVRNFKMELPRSLKHMQEVQVNFNIAMLNSRNYESAMSRLRRANFGQHSSMCVQSVVKSVEGEKLHLCCQYDSERNVQENIVVPIPVSIKHLCSDFVAKVTSLSQVTTIPQYQEGNHGISVQAYGASGLQQYSVSSGPLITPKVIKVPLHTLHIVVECIKTLDEQKAARAVEALKREGPQSLFQRAPATEPELPDACFLMLKSPCLLSPYQTIDIWMRTDTSQFIVASQPQLVDVTHNVRVCLHHLEQTEACFTSGSTMMASQPVYSSVESYVREWGDVLLVEAACRSIERKTHIIINDVLIQFSEFEALYPCVSERFYRPVGDVTAHFPNTFLKDRQDIFPLEQGDLVCARYEVVLTKEKAVAGLAPQLGRVVLHMVVKRVVEEGTQQEVLMSQKVVQTGVVVRIFK